MHKRIVKALEQLFSEWDKDKKCLHIVIREKPTEGFWGMYIAVEDCKSHIIPHLESIALSVGRLYGEEVCIFKEKDIIVID